MTFELIVKMKTRSKRMAGAGEGISIVTDRKESAAEFSGSWILTESQEFIRRTFAFLPAKTLGICSRVCKAWQTEVKRVLHFREEIGWATYGRLQAEEQNAVNCPDPLGPFGVNLNKCLESIGSLPRLAVMFSECWPLDDRRRPLFTSRRQVVGSDSEEEDSPRHCRAKRKRGARGAPLKALCSRLPVESSVICVVARGTVGCRSDLSPAGESEEGLGVSCALLPKMEGVTVHYGLHNLESLGVSTTKDYIRNHRLPTDTQCVLVIQDSTYLGHSSYAQPLQHDFYTAFGTRPVICGGIARQILVEPQNGDCARVPNYSNRISRRAGYALTIAFSGPRVKAASVVLGHWISTRDKVREKIRELKKAGLPEERSLAFMFSCVARGRDFYREADVESGTFHELFPRTPLLGFFGAGEYGCDNLTCGKVIRQDGDEIGVNHRTAPIELPNLELAQTCVLCLLSFG